MMANNGQRREIWQERWQSLYDTLYSLEQDYVEATFDRATTLQSLVKYLRGFADGQFRFFYNGFSENASIPLERSTEYPPEFVLSTILDQAGNDLEIIQRAADQRKCGSRQMKDTLRIADKLAMDALQQAISDAPLLSDQTTVVTYFHKAPTIRVLPYAPVALVGVPYSCVSVPRDYLAIPHEVGHYVFRHRHVDALTTPVDRAFVNSVEAPYANWQEEIFADVFGCLIGGPLMALNFQDIELEHSYTGFRQDDNDHPTPTLRPYLYNKVLRSRATHYDNWSVLADQLEARWNELVDTRNPSRRMSRMRKLSQEEIDASGFHSNAQATPSGQTSQSDDPPQVLVSESYTVEQAISSGNTLTANKPLDAIIQAALDLLPNIRSHWSGTTQLAADLEGQFQIDLPILAKGMNLPPEFAPSDQPEQLAELWNEWVKREKFFRGQLPPTDLIRAGDQTSLREQPNGTWIQMWYAGGWSTQGPETEPHG